MIISTKVMGVNDLFPMMPTEVGNIYGARRGVFSTPPATNFVAANDVLRLGNVGWEQGYEKAGAWSGGG